MKAFAATPLWIVFIAIVVFVYMGASAVFSFKNNEQGGKWMGILFACNLLGPWWIISRYSHNIMRDGLIYDVCVMIVFYGVLAMLAGKHWHPMQYVAVLWCMIGIFMFNWFGR
jgi:hypothetical protein